MRSCIAAILALAPAVALAQPARPLPGQPARRAPALRPGIEALPPALELPSAAPPPAPTVSAAPLADLHPAGMEQISLNDAVRRAVQRNPSAVIARAEIARADALLREAKAALMPTLSANATYTRLDSDRKMSGTDRVVASANQENANLQLTVPLLQPQGWAARSSSRANRAAVEASAADVTRQVTTAVARAYLAVVSQRRVLEVKARARDAARAHYDYAHTRVVGGVGRILDEVRAAQEVATDDAQVESARSALTRSREALGVLVGTQGPLDASDDVQLDEVPSLNAAMDDARQRRADLRAGEAKLKSAEQNLRNQWAYYAPYVGAVVQPFLQNPASLTMPTTGWQAQLILTLPLYDGGLRYGVKRERTALVDEARASLEGQLRTAESEVRTGFEVMLRADAGLKAAREAASLAKRAFDMSSVAYQAGATSNIEVIDAERRWRDAETDAAVAEDAARQARLDLLVAAGRFP